FWPVPVTLPEAELLAMVPAASFWPTRPPANANAAAFTDTAPLAEEPDTLPEFSPTSPPAVAERAVPVTLPDAFGPVLVPGFWPAKPPGLRRRPRLIFPLACEFAIEPGPEEALALVSALQIGCSQPPTPGSAGTEDGPEFTPTSPPTMLPAPPVML